jgi:hypothetical protein
VLQQAAKSTRQTSQIALIFASAMILPVASFNRGIKPAIAHNRQRIFQISCGNDSSYESKSGQSLSKLRD